ncbi:uncharacterized protein LOC128232253 [Mya arenaria]|uniref:uncharacterized protein LOC128232253 n=1 Tax=Mya arenaria TaxID=6604 RepID=UPI0022E1B196|nr:uncharacterized protein LOC128232253 [Mya arenaria]
MATGGFSIYKGSDLIYDFSCSKCKENDFNAEAQHFCLECEHYLCDKCVKLHNGYHKKHNVYGRGDTEKWVVSSIDRCHQHGKELEVHCDDHQELCCSVCVALNHRLCNSISHLDNLAKGFLKKAEFKELAAKVDTMRSRLIELKKARTTVFNDSYKNIVAEIKALRNEIDTILDQIEKATVEQLDNMVGNLENDVKDDVDKCVMMNDQLKNLMEKINQMIGQCKETNAYIGCRIMTAKLTQANNLIGEVQRKSKEEIQFEADTTIESFLKSLNTLGLVEVKDYKDCMYQVVRSMQYNIKIKQDRRLCSIAGICELSSGLIVIADFSNCKVKLLNNTFQVIDHCDLSAPPFAMCHIAASEVAVAVDDNKKAHKVQFIKVSQRGGLKKVRKFTTDHLCISIAYHQDQLYVGSKTALYQYTMDGDVVKKIYENMAGDVTVARCDVSPDGERIYVLNFDKHKLISLDKCGQELAYSQLHSLSGLCVSLSGHVYVCSVASNTVLQVDSESTKKLAKVASETDGINEPWSLEFIDSTSSLVVGGYDNDNIVVLQLEKI